MIEPCTGYEALVERLLAGELGADELERLVAHAGGCAGCRAYVELHRDLREALRGGVPAEPGGQGLPDDAAFAEMRAAVFRRLAGARARATSAGSPRRRTMARLALAASWIGLLFTGLLLGRGLAPSGEPIIELDTPGSSRVLEAVHDGGVEELGRSPYVFSNVTVEDAEAGRLELTFDVTRHMRITRAPDDPLVKQILVRTMLDPAPVGVRLQAASFAARAMDPTVRDALIAAARYDPDQAVRGRCLELLAPLRDEPRIQSALVDVLRGDEEVALRLRAIDLLSDSADGRTRLDGAMEGVDGPDRRALLVRAANRLGR